MVPLSLLLLALALIGSTTTMMGVAAVAVFFLGGVLLWRAGESPDFALYLRLSVASDRRRYLLRRMAGDRLERLLDFSWRYANGGDAVADRIGAANLWDASGRRPGPTARRAACAPGG